MAVTDPTALRFSNERIRTAADRLARAYYLCKAIKDRWDSLGGGQPALDIVENDLRGAADYLVSVYTWVYDTEKIWFVLGSTSLIPDNPAETIEDGSPSDGRPGINGEDAVRVVTRAIQFQNWLLSSTGSFSDALRDSVSWINTVYAASRGGEVTLALADATNFISRCGELVTDYENGGDLHLSYLLAVAVNPGG